jgi:predicted  nucleic acid-binding Zn-ribbon protein
MSRGALAQPSPDGGAPSAGVVRRAAAPLGGTGVLEMQRIRSELLRQIQEAKSVQESQLKDLDSRLSEAKRDLQPRLRYLETCQSISQGQLEQAQRKFKDIAGSDVSNLRRQLDDLQGRFDRFAKINVQSSIKPMSDDFRQSKAKFEELVISTTSSFKRLSDAVKEIADNLNATHTKLRSEHTGFATDLDDLEPKVCSVEQQIGQLRVLMEGIPSASRSAALAGQLAEIPKTIARIENEVLPAQIEKLRVELEGAISEIRKMCDAQMEQLSAGLDEMSTSDEEMEERRSQAEQFLAIAMTKTFDIERSFSLLSEDTRTRLRNLDQGITSKLTILITRIADFSEERANRATEFDSQAASDLASVSGQIEHTVKALSDQVGSRSEENEEAQVENMEKIVGLRDQIDGPADLAGRVCDAEGQLNELVAGVEETMGAWVSPKVVAARLKRIEDRLLEYETKLNQIDSQGIGKSARFTPVIEAIPEPPLETPKVVNSPP